jgi:hypothetical protein
MKYPPPLEGRKWSAEPTAPENLQPTQLVVRLGQIAHLKETHPHLVTEEVEKEEGDLRRVATVTGLDLTPRDDSGLRQRAELLGKDETWGRVADPHALPVALDDPKIKNSRGY